MLMRNSFVQFIRCDHGAVTVDWTTLSAAAVGVALATAGALSGTLDAVISRLDGELRDQQMSDSFVTFTSAHFEPLYEANLIDAEMAAVLFDNANQMLNNDVLTALQEGIEAMHAGELSAEELGELMALASVAYQRNLVPDEILAYYFSVGEGGAYNNANQFADTM